LRAIGYAIAAFTFWVGTNTCAKLAGGLSVPPYEIAGFIGLVGVVIMPLAAQARGDIGILRPKKLWPQLLRGLLILGSNFFNAIAVRHLPLTVFYVVVFTSPLLVAIMAAFFLHERLDWRKTVAILAGFAGVIIAVDPTASVATGDWIGYAATMAGALAFSANIVWLRTMTQTESLESLVFIASIVNVVGGFAPALTDFRPLPVNALAAVLGAGLFSVLGNLASFKALRQAPAAIVSQFHYTQIVTGALVGYLIWRDIPTTHLIAGAIIIVGAGLYVANHARKAARAPLVPE